MIIADMRTMAAAFGRNARYAIRLGDDDFAYTAARDAANNANRAIEAERRRDAPTNTILRNRLLEMARLSRIPRCGYRRIGEKVENGETIQMAADPCGGKIKDKKRAGVLVGFECQKCGRYAAWVPPTQEALNELVNSIGRARDAHEVATRENEDRDAAGEAAVVAVPAGAPEAGVSGDVAESAGVA